MKLDEMSDMCTILVEPEDERAAVVSQVARQRKPVVIVVPELASHVFRHPGHFVELRQLKRQRGVAITLVIMGNEQIRNYARRQGFAVYSSQETCARALARRDRLYAARYRTGDVHGEARGVTCVQEREQGRMDVPELPAHFGQFDMAWYGDGPIVVPSTDPLVEESTQPLPRYTVRGTVDTVMLVLVVLLVIGILGGVGFGYLLSMVS
ncbi:MAG: hypothetical protein J2P36_01935 [Ktedonobacteraceae bacterium]|nr:hypothetical protein [Ktedonobacteraceae bacterium]